MHKKLNIHEHHQQKQLISYKYLNNSLQLINQFDEMIQFVHKICRQIQQLLFQTQVFTNPSVNSTRQS